MDKIDDMQIGKAGEYLVCAELITKGFVAYLSEQGLPYDVVLDNGGRLLKVQVKTTRTYKYTPQRKTKIPIYQFNVGRNGKNNKRNNYHDHQVDLFAVVALDAKTIGYIHSSNVKSTMNFRVPEFRGKYHDEQGVKNKRLVADLKSDGISFKEIANKLNMKLSTVYRYSANVSIEQSGANAGVYLDDLHLKDAME